MRRLSQFGGWGAGGLKNGAGKIEQNRITQGNTKKTKNTEKRGRREGDRWENQRSGARVEQALEGVALKKYIRKKTTVLL